MMDVRRCRYGVVKKKSIVLSALIVVMLAIVRVDACARKRTSVGLVVYSGFVSHGFDVAEVAMEMVARGYDAFVSVSSHDVKPFMRYITQSDSSSHVDVHQYVGDASEAARAEGGEAKLWLVVHTVEMHADVVDFERAWLRGGGYTSERSVDDMKRDYFLRFIQEASELNDPMKSTTRILDMAAHSCRSMMESEVTSEALASVDMMIIDAAVTCAWFEAVRFQVRYSSSSPLFESHVRTIA